ncbi:DUF6455 family protein [uncultured Shimia sp.]|uniref:DUF6455 family protein n=1 Tax=uncultured Shimia sp. TaxID=573152 RepID=UPI002620C263|nr:DUF6455 family protein [uncultured Shimia sp.]
MKLFKKIDDHSNLMGTMSGKVGVNWSEVLVENPEMVKEYRNAVMTCTHCKDVGECKGWLAEHDSAPQAPDYCLNRGLLGKLAEG